MSWTHIGTLRPNDDAGNRRLLGRLTRGFRLHRGDQLRIRRDGENYLLECWTLSGVREINHTPQGMLSFDAAPWERDDQADQQTIDG